MDQPNFPDMGAYISFESDIDISAPVSNSTPSLPHDVHSRSPRLEATQKYTDPLRNDASGFTPTPSRAHSISQDDDGDIDMSMASCALSGSTLLTLAGSTIVVGDRGGDGMSVRSNIISGGSTCVGSADSTVVANEGDQKDCSGDDLHMMTRHASDRQPDLRSQGYDPALPTHVPLHVSKTQSWSAKCVDGSPRDVTMLPFTLPTGFPLALRGTGEHLKDQLCSCGDPGATDISPNFRPFRLKAAHPKNPYIVPQHLQFLLGALNPCYSLDRSNNFFNTLDAVAGDLLSRFPNDVAAHGLRNALLRLEGLYDLNFNSPSVATEKPIIINGATCQHGHAASGEASLGSGSTPLDLDAPRHGHGRKTNSRGNRSGRKSGHRSNLLQDVDSNKKPGKKDLLLDCPISKDCDLRHIASPCTFDGAANMWEVRQHLNSGIHNDDVPYLKLCRKCWEDVVSPNEYEYYHNLGQCRRTSQPRGSRVVGVWLKLFRKLRPNAERIPTSPYVGIRTWTPAHPRTNITEPDIPLNAETGFGTGNFQPNESFLDHEPSPVLEHPSVPGPQNFSFEMLQMAEAAWIEICARMFGQYVQRPFDISDYYMREIATHTSSGGRASFTNFGNQLLSNANHGIQNHMEHPSLRDATQISLPQNSTVDSTFTNIAPSELWMNQLPVPEHLQSRRALNGVPQNYFVPGPNFHYPPPQSIHGPHMPTPMQNIQDEMPSLTPLTPLTLLTSQSHSETLPKHDFDNDWFNTSWTHPEAVSRLSETRSPFQTHGPLSTFVVST